MLDNLFSMLKTSDISALLKEYANNDEAYLGYLLVSGFKSEKSNASKAA